jgi:hypothetical protein
MLIFANWIVCRYNDDEIERKVSMFRQMLMEKIQETIEDVVEKDEAGRPM